MRRRGRRGEPRGQGRGRGPRVGAAGRAAAQARPLRNPDAERTHWVGLLARHGAAASVTPYRDDAEWRIAIGPRDTGGAEDGDVVVVEPLRAGRTPRGRVIEVLGRPGAPEADFRAVVWRRGLRTSFPADAEAEAAGLSGVKIGRIRIKCQAGEQAKTLVTIEYIYTALSESGNEFIDRFTANEYVTFIGQWAKAINYYLKTGKTLSHQ